MILVLESCKRTFDSDFKGPGICVPEGFNVSNYMVTPEIDFSLKDSLVKIKIDLSHEVNWDLKIVGRSSKALKKYSGKSNKINISWLGNPDSSLFFTEEVCDVQLTMNCITFENKSFLIKKKSDFSNFGLLLTDFDGNGLFGSTTIGYGDRGYASYGTNADGSDLTVSIDVVPLNSPSPQGGNYFYQKATNGEAAYYACGSQTSKNTLGGFNLPTTNTTSPSFRNTFPGITSPDSIYVNFYLNVNNNPQTGVLAWYQSGSKKFNLSINPNWTGWKYLSYKMSDFKDASGLPIPDITRVTFWGFDLQSKDKGPQTVEAAYDFVIFTKSKPLFPNLVED